MKLLLHTCCTDCLLKFLEVTNCRPQDKLLINQANIPATSNVKLNLSDITIFFYNPNIYPRSEYEARRDALVHLAEKYQLPIIISDYQPDQFFALNSPDLTKKKLSSKNNKTTALQTEEELHFAPQNIRCPRCWSLRLQKTLEYAQNYNQELLNSPPIDQPIPLPQLSQEHSLKNKSSHLYNSPNLPKKFTHFSTTLLVSQYQNYAQITQIGTNLGQNYGLFGSSIDNSVVDKNYSINPINQQNNKAATKTISNSDKNITFLSPDTTPVKSYRTGGFYKQNYCGCLFSLIERTGEKYSA